MWAPLRRSLSAWIAGSVLCWSASAMARDSDVWQHRVRAREVAGQIAERYRVRLAELARANPGFNLSQIRTGQRLLIPHVHEVQSGEVLGQIAQRYGVTLAALRSPTLRCCAAPR